MACSTRTAEASLARFLTLSSEGMVIAARMSTTNNAAQQPPMMAIQNQALQRGRGGGMVYAEDGSGAGGGGGDDGVERSSRMVSSVAQPGKSYWRATGDQGCSWWPRRGRL